MSGCRRFLHVKRLARQRPYQTQSHNPVIPLSDITNVISDNPNLAEEVDLNMPPPLNEYYILELSRAISAQGS